MGRQPTTSHRTMEHICHNQLPASFLVTGYIIEEDFGLGMTRTTTSGNMRIMEETTPVTNVSLRSPTFLQSGTAKHGNLGTNKL
jgi:hypothetical protein